jgi:hypothetical protein
MALPVRSSAQAILTSIDAIQGCRFWRLSDLTISATLFGSAERLRLLQGTRSPS